MVRSVVKRSQHFSLLFFWAFRKAFSGPCRQGGLGAKHATARRGKGEGEGEGEGVIFVWGSMIPHTHFNASFP